MEDYYNMIEIEKSLTADSRTAEYIINKGELISGTKQHMYRKRYLGSLVN